MSRVTPPVTKLTHAIRSLSSSSIRSSGYARYASQYLPRKLSELQAECSKRQLNTSGSKSDLVERLAAHDLGSRPFHSSSNRRPATPVFRTIPLMQGFRTSAPKQSAHDTSTIDFFYFPEVPEEPPANPFARVRVPLLPDNYSPDRSANSVHAIEEFDEPTSGPEINIIASHPENVAPAALSEVVGNDGLDVDIGHLIKGFSSPASKEHKEAGLFKELWSGIVDDILGPKSPTPKASV